MLVRGKNILTWYNVPVAVFCLVFRFHSYIVGKEMGIWESLVENNYYSKYE